MATQIPAAWGKAKRISIMERRDKAELVAVPFLIKRAEVTSKDGYTTIRVVAEDVEGKSFEFTDSSTGVKEQLLGLLEAEGFSKQIANLETGEFDIAGGLVIDGGLRVSNYEKELPSGGKRMAQTYYLVASK